MQTVTLSAPDISCAHCVKAINGAVGALNGVNAVSTDEATKQVVVQFDPGVIDLARIEATLEDEGYPVAK